MTNDTTKFNDAMSVLKSMFEKYHESKKKKDDKADVEYTVDMAVLDEYFD